MKKPNKKGNKPLKMKKPNEMGKKPLKMKNEYNWMANKYKVPEPSPNIFLNDFIKVCGVKGKVISKEYKKTAITEGWYFKIQFHDGGCYNGLYRNIEKYTVNNR